jgi:cellulose synthase/poly-beta-1,6-N-acetylglucosamine synthase-like glycosyltransferase
MNAAMLVILFWWCAAMVVYVYAGYPLLAAWLARRFGRLTEPRLLDDEQLPSISLLVAAHNEESVIRQRLENALAMDYPTDKLEIVVASDGSSDQTAAIVKQFGGRGVRLLDFHDRRGKASVLNAAVASLRGGIVLLSDANTFLDPSAARRLVRWFADDRIGVVCGRLVLSDPQTGQNVDSLYWKYETFIKKCEARLGALLGANGAIYALRREEYQPIPGDTIVDDMVIPLLAYLRTGCRTVYDAQAVAYEETPPRIASEFRRRARIGAGGFQSLARLWRLLDPRRGWIALAFLSHKVLRWLCPFFLLGMLAANLLLLDQPLYRLMLAAQLMFYAVSAAGTFLPGSAPLVRLIRATTMFSSMNLALLVGFGRWLTGRQRGAWQRTARPSPLLP